MQAEVAIAMTETPVQKVNFSHSAEGDMGQVYLAAGSKMAMRLWEDETPTDQPKPTSQRDYETIGYVLKGRAELHVNGQVTSLGPGDSWVVPENAPHTYQIMEPFSALEATSPPARQHSRDSVES